MYNQNDAQDYEQIAKYIQKELSRLHRGGKWHVIVGNEFGDWVKAKPNSLLKFKQGDS